MENLPNDRPGPESENPGKCTVVSYQPAAVSVPITVRPNVVTGGIRAYCCGDPVMRPASNAGRTNMRPGDARCSFTITQDICIEIPIEFSAQAFQNAPHIEFGNTAGAPDSGCGDLSFQKG